jgi:hypothetical protein
MSPREHLHFNHKFDSIEGFEDCGSQGRICNIANHALVFMNHGLRGKWKEPVAYYRVSQKYGYTFKINSVCYCILKSEMVDGI